MVENKDLAFGQEDSIERGESGTPVVERTAPNKKIVDTILVKEVKKMIEKSKGSGGQFTPEQVTAILKLLESMLVNSETNTLEVGTNLEVDGSLEVNTDLGSNLKELISKLGLVTGLYVYNNGRFVVVEELPENYTGVAVWLTPEDSEIDIAVIEDGEQKYVLSCIPNGILINNKKVLTEGEITLYKHDIIFSINDEWKTGVVIISKTSNPVEDAEGMDNLIFNALSILCTAFSGIYTPVISINYESSTVFYLDENDQITNLDYSGDDVEIIDDVSEINL